MLALQNQEEKDKAREVWFQGRLKKAQDYVDRERQKEAELQKEADRPLGMMVPARSSSHLK